MSRLCNLVDFTDPQLYFDMQHVTATYEYHGFYRYKRKTNNIHIVPYLEDLCNLDLHLTNFQRKYVFDKNEALHFRNVRSSASVASRKSSL